MVSINILALEQFNIDFRRNCLALEILANADIDKVDIADYQTLLFERTCEFKQLLSNYDILLNCFYKKSNIDY